MDTDFFYQVKTWPFEEAKKLLPIAEKKNPQTDFILFETGYGPSGLPHMGTFGEVVRTSMIRYAFSKLSSFPTKLICFSDDMDGLRKVPDNVPNKEKLQQFLNFPLTVVPDPFDEFDSFGTHNNNRLKVFLDSLGLDYTFYSATECYKTGIFDKTLLEVLAHHKEILDLMLPTLGPDRQATYSPFLPISPKTGRVLLVPMEEYRQETVVFRDEDGSLTEVPVTGGHCKLQWKVDWGMRWKALGIDYEMAGKDLIDSVTLATGICRILGGTPPQGMIAEHFVDEIGQKISKSKGNGLSVEEWMTYGPVESLAYMMYNTPRRAKKLYFDSIPRCSDEYIAHLNAYGRQTPEEQVSNPVWYIHHGHPPFEDMPSSITFSLLLNLASVCRGGDPALLWRFIQRSYPSVSPETHPFLDRLVHHATVYWKDRVKPLEKFRQPTDIEAEALLALKEALEHNLQDQEFNTLEEDENETEDVTGNKKSKEEKRAQDLQTIAYEIGKEFFPNDLKQWFSCFYEVLMGQATGPRVGSFINLYGEQETIELLKEKLKKN